MIKKIITYSFGFVLLIATSCSNQKNTLMTRAYHNLTSHYNLLFNANELYKDGLKQLEKSFEYDYSKLLPVFLYNDFNFARHIDAETDVAIEKTMKLVSLHSITVKPKLPEDNELSEKQRAFYNKSEYNKWIDDTYLLMGKSYYINKEFDEASQSFEFVIANFPSNNTIYETKIWLAKLYTRTEKFKEAEGLLSSLEKDLEFPKKLKGELYATKAYLAISRKNYEDAIINLKKALSGVRKFQKQRLTYLIAQLYQKLEQYNQSSLYYKKVIKLTPPYEMAFNATINIALTYEAGLGSRKDIEKQLHKMIRDDKNIEFQDQIYYAWGNLYNREDEKEIALDYYLKSATTSQDNNKQAALTYLTIADIYYSIPDYINAQSFYDSTLRIIDSDYPNYQIIMAKSNSLTNLVDELETINYEDSVLKLAALSTSELNTIIDDIIAKEKQAQEEARLKEEERLAEEAMIVQQQFELQTSKGSNWYFYNPSTLNTGKREFRRKWGVVRVMDDWRRSNKSTSSYETGMELSDNGQMENDNTDNGKQTNIFSRDYYLRNIPFSDSAQQVSHERIEYSLFESAEIYYSELKDYEKAIKNYSDLISRYPEFEKKLYVYYQLYNLGELTKNITLLGKYQQKIVQEFPNSNYAKIINNPDYFKDIEKEEKKFDRQYDQIYNSFMLGNYAEVAHLSKKAIEEQPQHELIPQLKYMLVVSEGIAKDTVSFIGDLQKLISKYPNTEISTNATLLVDYLENVNPEAAYEQEMIQAKELFNLDTSEAHYVVIAIQKRTNLDQLLFNVTGFNIDFYDTDNLTINKVDIGQMPSITILTFKNSKKAVQYLNHIKKYPELWRDVIKSGSKLFAISRTNYSLLNKEGKLEQYILFYNKHYSLY